MESCITLSVLNSGPIADSQQTSLKDIVKCFKEPKFILGAVSWYVTQLHPWHYFGATFKGGAVFA